jgi:hypothetical protein
LKKGNTVVTVNPNYYRPFRLESKNKIWRSCSDNDKIWFG